MVEIYDKIGKNYASSRKSDLFRIFDFSLIKEIGNSLGKEILDLGCGAGHFTRLIAQNGCLSITGVDVSPAMIKLAEEKERTKKLGIKYICDNVATLGNIGKFDLITASHLLHHAKNRVELIQICKNIYSNLKEGGTFITLGNIGEEVKYCFNTSKFGYMVEADKKPINDGDTLYLTIFDEITIKFPIQFYTTATYLEALRLAGFNSVQWQTLSVPEELLEDSKSLAWKNFPNSCHFTIMKCR